MSTDKFLQRTSGRRLQKLQNLHWGAKELQYLSESRLYHLPSLPVLELCSDRGSRDLGAQRPGDSELARPELPAGAQLVLSEKSREFFPNRLGRQGGGILPEGYASLLPRRVQEVVDRRRKTQQGLFWEQREANFNGKYF